MRVKVPCKLETTDLRDHRSWVYEHVLRLHIAVHNRTAVAEPEPLEASQSCHPEVAIDHGPASAQVPVQVEVHVLHHQVHVTLGVVAIQHIVNQPRDVRVDDAVKCSELRESIAVCRVRSIAIACDSFDSDGATKDIVHCLQAILALANDAVRGKKQDVNCTVAGAR